MKQHQTNSFISRAAAMLLTVIMAFAGAQTAWAQNTCDVTFYISSGGTVELPTGYEWLEVTNGDIIVCNIPSVNDLTITPETGYYVSSVTYDAPAGLSIDLNQRDDFHWYLYINPYEGSETPTITVHIVFDKALAGGADEASAVALTSVDDFHLAGGWYKVESDLTLGHTVNLHGDTHITIATGKTLTVNTSDEYGISGSALTVSGEGMLNVSANQIAISVDNYTQTGCAVTLSGETDGLTAENNVSISGGSLTTSGADIETNQGAITISGGTVSASGDQCGLYACDAVSITGGTVSASGNNYGIRGYSVSITGGQVTASRGGIRSNYGDITLGLTSATDYITASGFTLKEGFYMKIADGQTLYGGGFPSASFKGTVDDPSALNGLMLRPTAAVTKSGTNEYTIWNADGWDAFCDALQDNDTYNRFSGKTVKLGADITVSRMAGSGAAEDLTANDRPFCGTFDGGGNKLTFKYGSAGSPADENNIAPFRYVNNATIQHLHVDGDIYTRHTHAGGIVGQAYGTTNITDCRSSVNIISSITGDGTHGGIMSCSWTGSTTSITGCLFDGSIQSASGYTTNQCGGFVGWRNATINVSNSLLTADLSTIDTPDGLTYPSATFVRNGNNNTITNCYYTQPFGTAQGKALHTVTAGDDVTVAHAGVATHYATSGITAYKATGASADSDPFIAGLLYNNNVVDVLYAGSGDVVSLTLSNTATGAPAGYQYAGYTASAGTLDGSTLTMPAADVTVSLALRSTGVAVEVSYVDAGGTPQTAQAIALDGHETVDGLGDVNLAAGWYFVGKDISYTATLTLGGDVHLILKDGCAMNVGTSSTYGINSENITIYGQTLGTGQLSVTSTANNGSGIHSYEDITINGGKVTATAPNGIGIYADYGTVAINGGNVEATGGNDGISGRYGIILGWNKPTDRITASSYYCTGKSVTIAPGYAFHNGSEVLSGTISESDYATKLEGMTLAPAVVLAAAADNTTAIATAATACTGGKTLAVQLQGRTLYKDGAWNTLVLPFTIDDIQADGCPLNGATVRQLSKAYVTSTTLTLNFSDPTMTMAAGTPYIVKWPLPDGMTAEQFDAAYAANPDPYELKNPLFRAVTLTTDTHDYDTQPLTDPGSDTYDATLLTDERVRFIGTYDHKTIDTEDRSILFLGAANTLYYPSGKNGGTTIAPFRAYFKIGPDDAPAAARQLTAFNLTFGDGSEAQGIGHTEITEITEKAGAWYTIDGVRLDAQPTKKGLYIHGGRKVVIP